MTASVRSFLGGYDLWGWELDGRRIWWTSDSERPTYSVPCLAGGEACQQVPSRAFDVPLGPLAQRRRAMHRAALAFFAPLLDAEDGPTTAAPLDLWGAT